MIKGDRKIRGKKVDSINKCNGAAFPRMIGISKIAGHAKHLVSDFVVMRFGTIIVLGYSYILATTKSLKALLRQHNNGQTMPLI